MSISSSRWVCCKRTSVSYTRARSISPRRMIHTTAVGTYSVRVAVTGSKVWAGKWHGMIPTDQVRDGTWTGMSDCDAYRGDGEKLMTWNECSVTKGAWCYALWLEQSLHTSASICTVSPFLASHAPRIARQGLQYFSHPSSAGNND